MMRSVALVLGLFLLCSCVSLMPPNGPPTDACQYYDDAYLAWYATSIASGGLAGATGAGGVLTATLADEPYADMGLAISSTVFGVLATLGSVLAGEYASRYSACQARELAPPEPEFMPLLEPTLSTAEP